MDLARVVTLVVLVGCGGDDGAAPDAMRTGDAAAASDASSALDGDAMDAAALRDSATPADVAAPAGDAGADALPPEVDAAPTPDGGAQDAPSEPDAAPACTADRDCDDGVLCNGAERCDPRAGCVAADPSTVCEDRDPCTTAETCDASSDSCVYVCNRFERACDGEPICASSCVIDDDCNDGFFCSGRERCVDGTCRGGELETCDDGNPCTVEIGCLRTADACVRECNARNPSCDCGDAG